MEKPKNWDSVQANTGDYESLKLGGHEVIIKSAEEYVGMTGNHSLKVEVDIAGNDEQRDFFQKQYNNNTNADKRWSSASTKYISLKDDDNCVAMFKGFTTCVEKSNPGYTWNFDERTLIGKKLCGVYGLEEFEKQDGTVGTATKLVQFRSLDKLKDVKIPKVKLLDGTLVEYEEYKNRPAQSNDPFKGLEDVVEITDSFLD